MRKPRMRPLVKKPAPWIVYYWLPVYLASEGTIGYWHLAEDVADDMRAWCIKNGIKPAPKLEFLRDLAARREHVTKDRPWKLNPFDHGYAMQRLKARGKRTDRPMLYFFNEAAANSGSDGRKPDLWAVSDVPQPPITGQKSATKARPGQRRAA